MFVNHGRKNKHIRNNFWNHIWIGINLFIGTLPSVSLLNENPISFRRIPQLLLAPWNKQLRLGPVRRGSQSLQILQAHTLTRSLQCFKVATPWEHQGNLANDWQLIKELIQSTSWCFPSSSFMFVSREPRKKPSYFLLYWMVNRDPYNGSL